MKVMRSLILFILFPLIANTQEVSDYERLIEAGNVLAYNYRYEAASDSLNVAIKIDFKLLK